MGATYPEGGALVPHPFSACPGGATVPEGGWRSIDSVCGDAVRPPPGVQVEATDAFRVRGLPSLPSSGQAIFGTQSAGCPKNYFGPQPVKAITLEPHKAGHWIARILLTVTAPGTYHFGRARITYELTGVRAGSTRTLAWSSAMPSRGGPRYFPRCSEITAVLLDPGLEPPTPAASAGGRSC